MTLKEKLVDIETLLRKLEEGWREEIIFNSSDVDYRYPHNKGEDLRCELNGGWATVCILLADLLGLTKFGEIKDTKMCAGSSLRDYASMHLNQQDIWSLMDVAEDFLILMNAKGRRVKQQSE